MKKPYVSFKREGDGQTIMGFDEYDLPLPREGEMVDMRLGLHKVVRIVHSPADSRITIWVKKDEG